MKTIKNFKIFNKTTPFQFLISSKFQKKNFSTTENQSDKILKFYKDQIDNSKIHLEEIFPKKISNRSEIINYFNFPLISKNISIENEIPLESLGKSILEPCWDMIDRGGKRWRPMLGLMITDLFKVNLCNSNNSNNSNDENLRKISDGEKKLYYQLMYLVEVLHNSSLILDDVEDKSEQRRNKPCVHLTFGDAIAINAGISLMFFPFHNIITRISDPFLVNDLTKAFFEEMSAIHLGQGWDIEMKIASRVPTINTYKDTVLMKTGVFPRLIVKLINIMVQHNYKKENNLPSSKKNDNIFINEIFEILMNIVDNMSIAFQIKDDLLNITESELSKRKGFFGEDIFEGKLTLMILHTLNLKGSEFQGERLMEILAMNTKNPELINEAVSIMEKNGSIKFGEDIMNKHVDLSVELCNKLKAKIIKANEEKNLDLDSIRNIQTLLFYLIDRKI